MMKWTLAGAAMATALGACVATPEPVPAPPRAPASRADICKVLAHPEAPAHAESRDEARAARSRAILAAAGEWREVGGTFDRQARLFRGPWGECASTAGTIDSLLFTADGRYARTEGSYVNGPLDGAWGHCLFEKTRERWDLVACEITAIS